MAESPPLPDPRYSSPGPSFSPPAATEAPIPQAQLLTSEVQALQEADYESHRNVYIAVHIPLSNPSHHKHKHRRRHHHKEHRHNTPLKEPQTPLDPCDRVKFILGTDETDHPDCDHTSHSIFTELEELTYDGHDNRMEWKETARWVKFEEDVEEGGDKWSKPHVAALSLHSLFELRNCMTKGSILLDLPAHNLAQISDYVLDSLITTGQLDEENRDKVRIALLQRHRHHGHKEHDKNFLEQIKSLGDIGRIHSSNKNLDEEDGDGAQGNTMQGTSRFPFSAPNLLNLPKMFGAGGRHSIGRNGNGRKNSNGGNGKNSNENVARKTSWNGSAERADGGSRLEEECHSGSEEDLSKRAKTDHHFMKKIPPGSEASNVLVGEVDFLHQPIIAFVRLKTGQLLGDLTEVPIPTRFLFILLGPRGHHDRYHEIGRSIATLMSDEVFHDVAYKARNKADLLAGIDEFLDKVTVLPPGEWDPQIRLEPPPRVASQDQRRKSIVQVEDDEPKRPVVSCSKYPFGGLMQDVKRRYPKYWSDIRDAFNLQCLAAIIFIYFANITPAVTFGGVLGDITQDSMGALEMILAVGIGNFIFALLAGQPLVILGGTGPTLIFEDIVYQFCTQNDIPYLNFRFWIGLWTSIIIIILVGVNASAIMRLFTRFTEEIFSALISFIFIYEALVAVWKINIDYPYGEWILYPTIPRKCDCYEFASEEHLNQSNYSNATNIGSFWDEPFRNCSDELLRKYRGGDCPDSYTPDVFLMSVILFVGTFMVSIYLKKFRNSRFFTTWVRRIVSDFAVLIAVIVWVLVDILAQVDTPKLTVPNVFEQGLFTDPNRDSLFINPFGNDLPGWAPAAAILPAVLATILLFMDQQITALIVNRKDHKLKKGPGYHIDMLIVGVIVFVNSALGIPWVVGATVRSITHVQSLFIYSPCTAPGDRPKFLGVREQRVTLFALAFLLGISIILYQVLQLLPMPVLYGIFLYIGVASLYGVQFVQRLVLFFIPNKYKPDYEFLRHIPNRRIHAYTMFQVIFLLLLCGFKVVNQISIVFPIMVILLVFGRWLVGFLFSKHDLELLDDPIPDKLYCCKRYRVQDRKEILSEEGMAEPLEDVDDKQSGHDLPRKRSGINITQEVDKCDLWRNIRKLDAPMPSPRRNARYGAKRTVTADHTTATEGPELHVIPEINVTGHDDVRPSLGSPRLLYQSTAV